ncbi:hypothetical protein PZ938_07615 [Luteipulveratus sp. YIM 133132]|uniref:hypothetical protein n=1 Tax=Luteipulveratus flavus TaxID=3031728 RepID=UPI0023B0AB00|nr:hypothetical protein [Luteipulveratus sp. YIM 133132]MDE9365469.1 hypothetical protein [Luteipulveratus sp. YIM 133132]
MSTVLRVSRTFQRPDGTAYAPPAAERTHAFTAFTPDEACRFFAFSLRERAGGHPGFKVYEIAGATAFAAVLRTPEGSRLTVYDFEAA